LTAPVPAIAMPWSDSRGIASRRSAGGCRPTCARRCSIASDEIRRSGRQAEHIQLDDGLPDETNSPLEHAIGSEALERYERALERLTNQERGAIVAASRWASSYEEMAEALGKPTADAARQTAQRALVRLVKEMQRGAQ
jgi:DNA-directed RNA polymerase specialized sigma24 family protein